MKASILLLVANIPSIMCVCAAGHLAAHGIKGWGWFLLAGALITHSYKSKSDKDDKK